MADFHAAVVPPGVVLQDGAAQARLDAGAGEQAGAGVHAGGDDAAALRQLVNGLTQALHNVGYAQSYRPKLREFSGAEGYSVEEFFADFNKYAQELNLPQSRQAARLIDHLRGNALKEIKASSAEVQADVHLIKERLRNQFQRDTHLQLYARFSASKQRGDESLLAFARRLATTYDGVMQACRDAATRELYSVQRDESLKQAFADGVLDASVEREVRRLCMSDRALSFNALRDSVLEVLGKGASTANIASTSVSTTDVQAERAQTKASVDEERVAALEQKLQNLASVVVDQGQKQAQLAEEIAKSRTEVQLQHSEILSELQARLPVDDDCDSKHQHDASMNVVEQTSEHHLN